MKPRLYFTYNGLRSSETHQYKRRLGAPWDEPSETAFELHRVPPIAENIELPADGDFVVQIQLFERHFYTPEDAANDGVDVHDMCDEQMYYQIGYDVTFDEAGGIPSEVEKARLGVFKYCTGMPAGAVSIDGWAA